MDRISRSPIESVVVTDSIPLSPQAQACSKIQQVSSARLLAEAIRRIQSSDSLSSLFV